ncbi:MAG: hypothetical protein JWN76_3772 [Chitinophagaceae bacterium]|nr:hypothetical protein [Chitinophagaceae bacterium]
MYTSLITTQDKALCHLFLHCCFRDGQFTQSEVDDVADKFVRLGLNEELNFKDELKDYNSYTNELTDEKTYIEFLVKQICPTNELALYSYCVELAVSDMSFDNKEDRLFKILGAILNIAEPDQELIQKLIIQRQLVQDEKFF